jgi:hypothetical protein
MTRSLSVFLLFIVVYFCASVTVADIVTNPTTMPLQKHAQLRGPQGPGAKRAVRASEEARNLNKKKSNSPHPPKQQKSQQPHHPQQQQAPKLTPKAQQQKPMLVQQPKNKQPPHQPVNVATKAVRAVKASKGISKQPTGREPSILQVEDLNHLDFSMSHFTDKLANKRIVFMGDSLIRYQYLSLIYALTNGQYLNMSVTPNPVVQRTYENWNDFLRRTNAMFRPLEYCDCFREETHRLENRFYLDSRRNLSIAMFYLNDLSTCQGHWNSWKDPELVRLPQYQYMPVSWTRTIGETLTWLKEDIFNDSSKNHGANRKNYVVYNNSIDRNLGQIEGHAVDDGGSDDRLPTVLIMNYGVHAHELNDRSVATRLLRTITEAKVSQFIWKTTSVNQNMNTTQLRERYYAHDSVLCGFAGVTCFNVSWTRNINLTSLMWDSVHFRAPVYNHLNYQLMDLIE